MLYKEITSEIICVGQIVLDCIVRNRTQIEGRRRNARADGISLNPGGDALNEAVVLTRLGHRVRLLGVTGDDHAGRLLDRYIEENGISDNRVVMDANLATPVAVIMVRENGERESVNSPAAMLGDYKPDPEDIRGAKILSLASLFRAPLDSAETILSLVREAKNRNMMVCADTKLSSFREIGIDDIADALPMIDYIFPNETEAAWMTGKTDYDEMARVLAGKGARNIIIKAGAKGCYVYTESGERFHVDAFPVEAVDSTGAGDNFTSGFYSAYLRGESIEECCRYGTACAAVCVRNQGAVSPSMSREAVDAVCREYGKLF